MGVVANFAYFLIWWQDGFTTLVGCGFGDWFCLVAFRALVILVFVAIVCWPW